MTGAPTPTPAIPPHASGPLVTAGRPLEEARAAMILVHGRGASPRSILELAPALHHPELAYLAPGAVGNTWYPNSFLFPTEANQPGLSSGLSVIRNLVERVEGEGIPRERIILLGFSQGACLTAEFAYRHPGRYGGVVVYSGGLQGPLGTEWGPNGSMEGTPVFLGCSDIDGHVPEVRVHETAEVFRAMGAEVTERIYPGMGHLVNEDEIAWTRELVAKVAAG